jgi:DNA-directed RNA polymerase subunit beta'
MCSKVNIIDAGDSDFTPGENINRALAISLNQKLVENKQRPILFKRVITGISRASLSTESFLSAASFQETARVLVEAVVSGRKDNLLGLKENVILGQLIPAGTGFNQSKIKSIDIQEEFDELDSE